MKMKNQMKENLTSPANSHQTIRHVSNAIVE